MRVIVVLTLIIACLVGAIEAGIALGDRQLFVSPPEAVAESFVRHLAAGRYDRARGLLLDERSTTVEALRKLADSLDRRVVGIHAVEGMSGTLDTTTATATVRIRGRRAEIAMPLSLAWSDGRWKVNSPVP
jgi:hypothetical protein